MLQEPRQNTGGNVFDLKNRSFLVTGGTGFFGRAFVKTLVETLEPKRVIVFSRDELKQSDMAETLSPAKYSSLRYFIGDVRDRERLEMALAGVDIVVHAAALKQVPAAEYNPFECIHTNVLGAENVVRASLRAGVKKVLTLSSDKAVNPVSLYGASKLAADKIFIAANNLSDEKGPKFSVVRYGNVIGSTGSVVERFQRLIKQESKRLPITHPDMTRFWLTSRQSVQFVLSCLEMMQGGEIFVPKIPSMKVIDLANAMAPQLEHTMVGIRPGEKLHEALVTEEDARNTTDLIDRYVITPSIGFTRYRDYCHLPKVAPGFSYTSDNNRDVLTRERFLELVNDKIGR